MVSEKELKLKLQELNKALKDKNEFNAKKLVEDNYYPLWIILDHVRYLNRNAKRLAKELEALGGTITQEPKRKNKRFNRNRRNKQKTESK